MKYFISIIILYFFNLLNVNAQFITQGKIEYERKTNIKLQMQNEMGDNEWIKNLLPQLPQNISSYFDLYFQNNTSKFVFNRKDELKGMLAQFASQNSGEENAIFFNYNTNQTIAEKKVFETTYLISDSIQTYKWKLEDEIRVIAGYPCRKATTIIEDSVVVVAFYSDEIMVSGGPESVNGLPGMILGLAIPRLYTTWFATKVELLTPTADQLKPPTKGKKTNYTDLIETVTKSLKQYGSWGSVALWWLKI